MKARLRATDDLWFEVDGETEDELFKQISRVQEVFQHQACGLLCHQKSPISGNHECVFNLLCIDGYKRAADSRTRIVDDDVRCSYILSNGIE